MSQRIQIVWTWDIKCLAFFITPFSLAMQMKLVAFALIPNFGHSFCVFDLFIVVFACSSFLPRPTKPLQYTHERLFYAHAYHRLTWIESYSRYSNECRIVDFFTMIDRKYRSRTKTVYVYWRVPSAGTLPPIHRDALVWLCCLYHISFCFRFCVLFSNPFAFVSFVQIYY